MVNRFKRLIFSITAKHFYWVTAGNVSIILTGFLFTVVVARNLSPSDFGLYSAITSLVLILSDLGELGVGGGLSNFLPPLLLNKDKKSSDKVLKTTFLFQLFISLLIGFLLVILAGHISQNLLHSISQKNLFLIRLSALGVFSFMMFNFVSSVTISKEEFKKTFLIQNLYSFPKLIFISIAIFFLKLEIIPIFIFFLLGPLAAFIGGIILTGIDFLKARGLYSLKKVLSFSLFLGANKLFVALFSRLDILMLTYLTTTYEAGLYSVALRIAFIYPLIGGSLGTTLGPKYSRLTIDQAINFTKKVFALVFLMVLSLITVVFLSPLIINLIFGVSYTDSIPVAQLLLLANVPFLFSIPTNNLITYTVKKPQIIAVSSLIQLIIIFSLNLILIPLFGRFAPAISIGIAAFVAMMISFVSVILFLNNRWKV